MLGSFKFLSYLCGRNKNDDYEVKGILYITDFISCRRVDICVDMEPKMFLVVRLKRFLENLLECSVDIVRMHKHINPFLLKEIEHDGIYIIK